MTTAAIAIRERPIPFSAEMVRAVLDGTKTQTRRVVKIRTHDGGGIPGPTYTRATIGDHLIDDRMPRVFGAHFIAENGADLVVGCPYGRPGDRLWVREKVAFPLDQAANRADRDCPQVVYGADGGDPRGSRWRSSRFMPRWASRIMLELTDVRVEQVQEITNADIVAEGVLPIAIAATTDRSHPLRKAMFERGDPMCDEETGEPHPDGPFAGGHEAFAALWDSINAKRGYGWDVNPWVWVLEFKRVTP